MSSEAPVHPSADTWVAAIHCSEHDFEPLGAGVVVDATRVLTCAHVALSGDGTVREPLWVAFPKGDGCPRRRVATVTVDYSPPVKDLAVLILQEGLPAGVEPVPVRCPKPTDLANRAWWAFGFPDRDPIGNSADGQIGIALTYGWVRLDTDSRYLVTPGFSGGGLWSQDYEAVVGVVGQAHSNGDGRAITLHQADLCFPDHKLAMLANWSVEAAGDVALQQWGWALGRDPEGVRHWRPRARGVSIESERGFRFRGRAAALARIKEWLDRAQPDRRVLVVTGSPGTGKSAVLGRIVTMADAAIRASLPENDLAIRASVGSVSCAVHAKGKTALEVTEEIAKAASARLPEQAEDLAPAVRDVLAERQGRRFNVIIDALDEAASPAQAREIIDKIVLPLVETCTDIGAQVIVGTRRRDDGGDLLGRFSDSLTAIDLDDPVFFADEDLAAYALACLQLTGDERPGNPYMDDTLAAPLADRIAAMSGRNFLITGLIARTHGLHDQQAAAPDQLAFPATVGSALAAYVERLRPVAGMPAGRALTALAFAEAPGLTAELWQLALEAIDGMHVSADDLTRFARSSAANFLVETGGEADAAGDDAATVVVYRLFHQALNDALLSVRSDVTSRANDERALTVAFIRHGRLDGWRTAPTYLLRSLPGHAAAGGMIDDLLTDDAYLLYADLRRVMQVADDSVTLPGRNRGPLLRLTPNAITAGPADRAALFSVTEALENLGVSDWSRIVETLYQTRWASVRPRTERAILEGHAGVVLSVCTFALNDQVRLASGGHDATVRIWDPATGEQQAILKGHQHGVNGICQVTVNGRHLLASAGDDATVRIWDPVTCDQRSVLEGHQGQVWAVCPVTVGGGRFLASAGHDATVRIWNPATSEQQAVLTGHQGWIYGLCEVTVDGQILLASAGDDATARIWNPATGQQCAVLEGHKGSVYSACEVTVDGQILLASAGHDATVRIWNPATGQQCAVLEGHKGWIRAICAVTVNGQALLASAGRDRSVRIWDPATGQERAILEGYQDWVRAMCPITLGGHHLLATTDYDRGVGSGTLLPDTNEAIREAIRTELGQCAQSPWTADACCPVLETTRRYGSGTPPPDSSRSF